MFSINGEKKSHGVTKSYLKLSVIALISLSASPWWKREPPFPANSSSVSQIPPHWDLGLFSSLIAQSQTVALFCISAWLLSTTFVPHTVAHTQVSTFQIYLVPKCFTSDPVKEKKKKSVSHSVMSYSLWPVDHSPPGSSVHEYLSPSKNTGAGCHSLLQGDLPDLGIKPKSPPLQADSLLSKHQGSPVNQ